MVKLVLMRRSLSLAMGWLLVLMENSAAAAEGNDLYHVLLDAKLIHLTNQDTSTALLQTTFAISPSTDSGNRPYFLLSNQESLKKVLLRNPESEPLPSEIFHEQCFELSSGQDRFIRLFERERCSDLLVQSGQELTHEIQDGVLRIYLKSPQSSKKVGITFGTFDLFHEGHLKILVNAKRLCDLLVVGVSTDCLNYYKKRRYPVAPQEERRAIVSGNKYVDQTFFEESLEKKQDYINRYNASILIMGDDWQGKFDYLQSPKLKVIYLPRTKGISTTGRIESIPQLDPETLIYIRRKQEKNWTPIPGKEELPEIIYRMAYQISQILNKHQVLYFWTSGTLLGAIRSGGLLQWDDDLDLNLLDTDEAKIEAALNEAATLGYQRSLPIGNWLGQRLLYVKNGYPAACCDLFKVRKDDKGIYRFPTGWPKYYFTDEDVFPLKEAKFGNVMLKIPNLYHVILHRNYGDNYYSHSCKYNHSSLTRGAAEPLRKGEDLPAGPFEPTRRRITFSTVVAKSN